MELCKKNAQQEFHNLDLVNIPKVPKGTPVNFTGTPTEYDVHDLIKEEDKQLSDDEKSKFHTLNLVAYLGDELSSYIDELMSYTLNPKDKQVISMLNYVHGNLPGIKSTDNLKQLLSKAINYIKTTDADIREPVSEKLTMLIGYLNNNNSQNVQLAKRAIRSIFYSEGQLNPRLETDPSQSMPVGVTPTGGEIMQDTVPDDRTMEKPTNVHMEDQDKTAFEDIYKSLAGLVDKMDNTSHPSTSLFGRLRRDLGKAENSAWMLLYQLKNQGK